ncbi:MAG: bacteriocin [Thermoproteus sp.]
MEFIRVYLRPCSALPRDAVAHLGFRVEGGRVRHIVLTARGAVAVSKRCDDCVFYRLMSSSYVRGAPSIDNGVIKVIVADTRGARRVLAEHRGQVISVTPVKRSSLVLTYKQREVLLALANGDSISILARSSSRSKVAVYKLFRKALRKVVELV